MHLTGTNLQKDDDDEMNESDTTESYDNQPPSQSARARRQPRREQYRHNHGDQLSMAAADTGSSFRPPSTEYNEISNSKNASFLYSASSSAQRRSMLMSPRISGAGELSVTLQQRFAHREVSNSVVINICFAIIILLFLLKNEINKKPNK